MDSDPTLAASGILVLTIQFLMAPTHTIGGVNYADVWHLTLSIIGGVLLLVSAGLFVFKRTELIQAGKQLSEFKN
jgi:hypothetical protein